MASVVACSPLKPRFAAGRVLLPGVRVDAERLEQPRPQVLDQALAAEPLHDGGQGVGARLVVGEDRARLPVRRDEQEPAHRLLRIQPDRPLERLLGVPAGHRRDVADPHRAAARIGDVGVELREVGEDSGVEIQQALVHREARRGRGEALAQRVEQVHPIRPVRRPPALGDDLPVADDHQAVQLDVGCRVDGVQEGGHARGVDALGAGRTAGELGGHSLEPRARKSAPLRSLRTRRRGRRRCEWEADVSASPGRGPSRRAVSWIVDLGRKPAQAWP